MENEIWKTTKLRKMMEPEYSTNLLVSEALLLIMMWLIFRLVEDLNLRLQQNLLWSFLIVQILRPLPMLI